MTREGGIPKAEDIVWSFYYVRTWIATNDTLQRLIQQRPNASSYHLADITFLSQNPAKSLRTVVSQWQRTGPDRVLVVPIWYQNHFTVITSRTRKATLVFDPHLGGTRYPARTVTNAATIRKQATDSHHPQSISRCQVCTDVTETVSEGSIRQFLRRMGGMVPRRVLPTQRNTGNTVALAVGTIAQSVAVVGFPQLPGGGPGRRSNRGHPLRSVGKKHNTARLPNGVRRDRVYG